MSALVAIQTTTVPIGVGPVWNVQKRDTPTAWSYQAVVYEPVPSKGLLPIWRERERLGKPAPIEEDAVEVGQACGLPRYHAVAGAPILTAATVYAALGTVLGPAEEAAWRLGADYKVIAMARVIKNRQRTIIAIAKGGRRVFSKKRGFLLLDGRLVCRLGAFDQRGRTELIKSGIFTDVNILDHLPLPLEPERTPTERAQLAADSKVKTRAAKRAKLDAALRTWQRKLALAKTKVKQYTSKIKRHDRNMKAMP